MRSTEIAAELLRRQADGFWPEQPRLLGDNDAVQLGSIDFTSPLAAFYDDTYLRPQTER